MVCRDSFGLLAGGMCSEGSEVYGCGMRTESTLSRGGQGTAGDIRIGPSSIMAVYDGISAGTLFRQLWLVHRFLDGVTSLLAVAYSCGIRVYSADSVPCDDAGLQCRYSQLAKTSEASRIFLYFANFVAWGRKAFRQGGLKGSCSAAPVCLTSTNGHTVLKFEAAP